MEVSMYEKQVHTSPTVEYVLYAFMITEWKFLQKDKKKF